MLIRAIEHLTLDGFHRLFSVLRLSVKTKLPGLFQLQTLVYFSAAIFLGGCINPQINRQSQPITNLANEAINQALAQTAANSSARRYRLSIGDQIEVRYLRQLQYSTSVTVGFDGTVSLPFISSVLAEGKTIDELREDLEQKYLDLASTGPTPSSKKYLIGVGDVLEIKFPAWNEYNETITVRPDGKISLPLLDSSVIVEGKSPEDIKKELIDLYSQRVENFKAILVLNVVKSMSNTVLVDGKRRRVPVSGLDILYVTLKSVDRPKVYVTGEVVHPAAIPYEPSLSSLQAIITAGGVTNDAELRNVVILRKGSSESPLYIVRDLLADINGETAGNHNSDEEKSESAGPSVSLTNDILLLPNDVVIVPSTAIADVRDALNSYVFDLLPPLKNSSLGFSFIKPVGTQKIEQQTTVIP